MPNTLVEAMSVGLPIASSDIDPMPEILEDGGVYFDPYDAQSISEAIFILISDNSIRRHCSERSRELAKKYSWKKCCSDTFNFIDKVLRF
jgi:glycosyltransferase involved in cell wall biosynthesis